MIDIITLRKLHNQASEEVNNSVTELYKYKEEQHNPDFDHNIIKNLYKIYITKKEHFENIDKEYKTYLEGNGIYFYKTRI